MGHCLVGTEGKVWGIDHGLTFHTEPKLRSALWEFYQEPIPPERLADVRGLLDSAQRRGGLEAELKDLLTRGEVHGFFTRAERVIETGSYGQVQAYRRRSWPF